LYLISNFSGEFSFTKLKKFWVFECQYYWKLSKISSGGLSNFYFK
jgi:hypothetical protein